MSYRESVIGNPLPVVQVSGNHVELACVFASGGTAVNVTSPAFVLRQGSETGSTVAIPASSLLVPFSKSGPATGRYHICFLGGGWLSDGDYYLIMSGNCNGSVVSQTGTFTARTANSVQGYIDLLRSALKDNDGQLYTIEDTGSTLWSDGDLYDALTRSLNKINMTPPSRYVWDAFATVPWPNLLIDGGVIYALHSRGLLEVANTMNFQDELSFSIDRSQKYVSMLQVFANNYEVALVRVKRDYAFSRACPIGMGQTRIPMAVSRIFGFIPHMYRYYGL